MRIQSVRRIAAKLLNCGQSKIWIDATQGAKVKEAITTEDVKALIKSATIKKKRENFHSRGAARILQAQKRKGRKKGKGKRKGTQKVRMKTRESWIKRVRSLRKKLTELKAKGEIPEGQYKKFYKLIKGNYFKGRKQLVEEAAKSTATSAAAKAGEE